MDIDIIIAPLATDVLKPHLISELVADLQRAVLDLIKVSGNVRISVFKAEHVSHNCQPIQVRIYRVASLHFMDIVSRTVLSFLEDHQLNFEVEVCLKSP